MFSFPQKKDFFQIFFLVRVDSHFFPWAKPNVNSLHGLNPNLLFEIVSKHFHFELSWNKNLFWILEQGQECSGNWEYLKKKKKEHEIDEKKALL